MRWALCLMKEYRLLQLFGAPARSAITKEESLGDMEKIDVICSRKMRMALTARRAAIADRGAEVPCKLIFLESPCLHEQPPAPALCALPCPGLATVPTLASLNSTACASAPSVGASSSPGGAPLMASSFVSSCPTMVSAGSARSLDKHSALRRSLIERDHAIQYIL